ncbi:MAG: 5-formyltetrahydrofolate cyclo-ligase [Rhizobiales bacterium]|nr:5-formyltetrahydrofolate cyclo-ligase [Hyphomicrobiales bacterium]
MESGAPTGYASPPCFIHEIDPAYAGLAGDGAWLDVARWRKAERERLIAARLALSPTEREAGSGEIARALDDLLPSSGDVVVSLYWPFRGEPDLRTWMARAVARGLRVALPVVVAKATPLVFREWTPGCAMTRGVWGIPIPAETAPTLLPTVVIAPLVGCDPACYRLGYGGGFFDRTLAQLARLGRPALAIGVGFHVAEIPTIYPQLHDIPMDWIVVAGQPVRRRPA